MKKGSIIILLLFAFQFLDAQTKVEVLDTEKLGLPNAHVMYRGLNDQNYNTVLTDRDGRTVIPADFSNKNATFLITITYIGFVKVEDDTVKAGESLRFIMKEDMISLEQLVVTGQYSPNDPEKAVHKISIINSQKIESMAAVNLTDVLQNELNIRISQDNILGSSVSLQGMGGENVKILIDGVPMVGRTDGNIDLNQINLDNIERIEVVEGPMSVSYGTNALAGAINLITKKGSSKQWLAGVHAYTESVGKYNLTGNVNFHKGNHQVGLSGGRNYFDGWSEGDEPFDRGEQIADSTRVDDWNPKEQYNLDFQYGYQLNDWSLRYKLSLFSEEIINKGKPMPSYYVTAFDDYYYTKRFDNSFFAEGKFSENFNGNFIVAYNQFERQKNTYITDLTTLNQVISENPDDQDTSRFNQWTLRGILTNTKANTWVNYEVGYDINLEEGIGKRILDGRQEQGDYAVFSSAEIKVWRNAILRPGLRFSYNTNYESPLIPSLNYKQDFGKVSLRASYALGFRAPSLKEQYFEFVDSNHNIKGNPDLEAENSNNFNVSARYSNLVRNALYKAEISGFYNNIENLISLALIEGTEYSFINIDRYKTMGVNANFDFNLHHLRVNIGGSYIGRYNQFRDQIESSEMNWTPEVQFNVRYLIGKTGIAAALFMKYQGSIPSYTINDEDQVEEQFVDAYTWADLTLSKKFWKDQINFSAGIKNLFDVTSINATNGSSGGVHSGGGGNIAVGTGRSFFFSLKYTFKSKT